MSGGGPPPDTCPGGVALSGGCPGGVRGAPPPDVRGGPPRTTPHTRVRGAPRTPPGHRAPRPTSGGVLVGPTGHLSEGGWLCPGGVRGGVHLGLGFRMGLGLWGASSGGRPLEGPGNLLDCRASWRPLQAPGGPWRFWRPSRRWRVLEAWRPLEALEAPGGPWRPLEAPGGPWSAGGSWRLLEACGGPWRPLEAPGGPCEAPGGPPAAGLKNLINSRNGN